MTDALQCRLATLEAELEGASTETARAQGHVHRVVKREGCAPTGLGGGRPLRAGTLKLCSSATA